MPGKNVKSCLCTTNKCPFDNSKNKSSHKNSKQYCNNEPSIYIGSTKITFETEVRYLRVILDSKLLWNAHIKFLIKKLVKKQVSRLLNAFLRIYPKVALSLCTTLYLNHTLYMEFHYGVTPHKQTLTSFSVYKKMHSYYFW